MFSPEPNVTRRGLPDLAPVTEAAPGFPSTGPQSPVPLSLSSVAVYSRAILTLAETVDARHAAARRLGESGQDLAREPLEKALRCDPSAFVRAECARGLGLLCLAESIPKLIDALQDRGAVYASHRSKLEAKLIVAEVAARALSRFGDRLAPYEQQLAKALKRPASAVTQVGLCDAICAMPTATEGSFKILSKIALSKAPTECRRAAMFALERHLAEDAAKRLSSIADHFNLRPAVRARAIEALAMLSGEESRRLACDCLRNQLRGAEAKGLLAWLDSKKTGRAVAAADALATLGGEEKDSQLLPFLGTKVAEVRLAVQAALLQQARQNKLIIPGILRYINHNDTPTVGQIAAIRIAVSLREAHVIPSLLAIIEQEGPWGRHKPEILAATDGLLSLEDQLSETALSRIKALLLRDELELPCLALEMIGRMREKSDNFAEDVVHTLRYMEDEGVLVSACDCAAQSQLLSAIPALQDLSEKQGCSLHLQSRAGIALRQLLALQGASEGEEDQQ